MPRTARKKSKTGIYHIILRGVNRQTIFEDDEDKEKFLQILEKYKQQCGYKIYAYCLMGNHIHLLLKEEDEELGIIMRRIGASFVYWYNFKYERTGHLFQDRFKSEVVENDTYLLMVLRYIHQNPLKANIVKNISDYQWSSYKEYIGKSRIVDKNFILGLSDKDEKRALSIFREYHKIMSKDNFLDITVNRRLKDDEAIEIIKDTCKISHCIDLQKFEIEERDKYLRAIKDKGLSSRQIARLTGISRAIILRA